MAGRKPIRVAAMLTAVVVLWGCGSESRRNAGNVPGPGRTRTTPVLEGLEPAPSTPIGESKMTRSGVKYETLKEGTGEPVRAGQEVTIHYTGTLQKDGSVFDSSRTGGAPATFAIGVGELIRAWDEAVPGMKPGEVRKLTVPSTAGYGERGSPPKIPPNATLVFEIEMISAKDQ